jgi:hypothetical protein
VPVQADPHEEAALTMFRDTDELMSCIPEE